MTFTQGNKKMGISFLYMKEKFIYNDIRAVSMLFALNKFEGSIVKDPQNPVKLVAQ